jgi:DNA-binding NtrC family response regulator
MARQKKLSNLEVSIPLTVVLAVGLDSLILTSQKPVWQSAGYLVRFASSVREAMTHFRDGDFDLILLGDSIPADSRERLTYLIRASGSRIPVVRLTDSSSDCDSFADATIRNEPMRLMQNIGELMDKKGRRC